MASPRDQPSVRSVRSNAPVSFPVWRGIQPSRCDRVGEVAGGQLEKPLLGYPSRRKAGARPKPAGPDGIRNPVGRKRIVLYHRAAPIVRRLASLSLPAEHRAHATLASILGTQGGRRSPEPQVRGNARGRRPLEFASAPLGGASEGKAGGLGEFDPPEAEAHRNRQQPVTPRVRRGEEGTDVGDRGTEGAQDPGEAAGQRAGGDLAALDAPGLGGERRPVGAAGMRDRRLGDQPQRMPGGAGAAAEGGVAAGRRAGSKPPRAAKTAAGTARLAVAA